MHLELSLRNPPEQFLCRNDKGKIHYSTKKLSGDVCVQDRKLLLSVKLHERKSFKDGQPYHEE